MLCSSHQSSAGHCWPAGQQGSRTGSPLICTACITLCLGSKHLCCQPKGHTPAKEDMQAVLTRGRQSTRLAVMQGSMAIGLLLDACKGRVVGMAVQPAHRFTVLVSGSSVVRCTATPLQSKGFQARKQSEQAGQSGWLSLRT